MVWKPSRYFRPTIAFFSAFPLRRTSVLTITAFKPASGRKHVSINRRAFLSNSLAMTTGGLLATAAPASLGMNSTTKETDPLFNQPYVDVDEWRDSPSRHRYIHGGFRGTDTRFIIRMPPAEQYEGRFFQYLTPISISELQAGQIWNGTFPDFCFASGAMAVVSNQGGEESNTLYANTNPYS